MPGEWYSPTQPIPSKPPGYDWQGVTPEVLINFTPELHDQAMKLISRYNTGNLYMPPTLATADGKLGTLTTPGTNGGTDWPGGSYDPETHTVYVFSQTQLYVLGMIPNDDPNLSDYPYVRGQPGVRSRPVSPAGGAAPRETAPPAGASAGVACRPSRPQQPSSGPAIAEAPLRPHYRRLT